VIQGDSDLIPTGGGTGGSRSATVQNSATLALVTVMTQAYKRFLAEYHKADPADVSFDDEVFRIAGSNVVFSWLDAANLAREAGQSALLDVTHAATLDDLSFPNGAHVAEVEVDPQTGHSKVVRYVIVDDFGYLLNPMLVEGQVHGGVVQGLGQAMMEHVVYDDNGQLLTASFMDYGMPRAADVPMFDFNSVVVPSTANPIGMKGCGEAGTIGSMAAVSALHAAAGLEHVAKRRLDHHVPLALDQVQNLAEPIWPSCGRCGCCVYGGAAPNGACCCNGRYAFVARGGI